jgi:hypothetical protein
VASLVERLLPRPADRRVAKALGGLALAPLLLWVLAYVVPGPWSAEVRWTSLRRVGWPPATPVEPVDRPLPWGEEGETQPWYPVEVPGAPRDPWGGVYYAETAVTDDGDVEVFSAGPDGVFDGGVGDDVQVAGFFFFGWEFFLFLGLLVGPGVAFTGGAFYLAKRQADAARSERLGVELVRAGVIAFPYACAACCLAGWAFAGVSRSSSPSLPFSAVHPAVAGMGTAGLLVYLFVLHHRARGAGAGPEEGSATPLGGEGDPGPSGAPEG